MGELGRLFTEILAVRDCPAVRALVMDCFEASQERGEAEGVARARLVLAGVREYERHRGRVANWGKATREGDHD